MQEILHLFYQGAVGQKTIMVELMAKKSDKNKNIKKVLELLKFSLSLNDEEIMRSTIESVIEILEEEIKK